MHTIYLLPHRYKAIGWLLLVPSLVLGILWLHFDISPGFLTFNVPAPLAKLGINLAEGPTDFTEGSGWDRLALVLALHWLFQAWFGGRVYRQNQA